jgi:hypothetical protein
MNSLDVFTLVVAVLAAVIVFRLILPNLLVLLGKSPLRNGMAGGAEDASCYWLHQIDADLYEGMTTLGFKPLGVYWEQMPTSRRFVEVVFSRPGEPCYGMLYPNDQIMPRRASFLTVFASGAVVFTKNYRGGVEIDQADFRAEGVQSLLPPRPPEEEAAPDPSPETEATLVSFAGPTARRADLDQRASLVETLEWHLQNVAEFLDWGHPLPPAFDADGFLTAQHRYHAHPLLRRKYQATMGNLLRTKLAALSTAPMLLGWQLGVRHPLPWCVLLLEGLIGLYLRFGCSSAAKIRILRTLSVEKPAPPTVKADDAISPEFKP